MSANSDAAPLTDREKILLERLDRLEQRLEAMEAKDGKDVKPAAPWPARQSTAACFTRPRQRRSGRRTCTRRARDSRACATHLAGFARGCHRHQVRGKSSGNFDSARPSRRQRTAAAPAPQHVLPEALEAPDPSPPNSETVYNWADFTWMNGNSRNKTTVLDTKFFTPEVRFDTHFMNDFNQPNDHTMGGATESFRSGEVQLEQVSVGGDFHWQNVRGRVLYMDGLFATTTPRNDASAGVGQWDVRGAYKYVSEA